LPITTWSTLLEQSSFSHSARRVVAKIVNA